MHEKDTHICLVHKWTCIDHFLYRDFLVFVRISMIDHIFGMSKLESIIMVIGVSCALNVLVHLCWCQKSISICVENLVEFGHGCCIGAIIVCTRWSHENHKNAASSCAQEAHHD